MSTFSQPPATFDDHAIETPEQVALYFPLAGLGSRFLAAAVDAAIQAAVVLVLILVVVIVIAALGTKALDTMSNTAAKWFIALMILGYFLLYWGYYALFEAFRNGQTPGKRVMKIRVIKDSGRQITFFEALARNLVRVVDYMPTAYLVGVISILVTKQNKRLGDLVAGTIVVHERVDEFGVYPSSMAASRSFTAAMYNTPMAAVPELTEIPSDRVARLSHNDLHLIDSFLARAISLPMEVRAQLGSRLLDTLCVKMDVPVPTDVPPERTLEAIAYTLRSIGRI